MDNRTISFNPDGTAHGLWTDAVPLHELGRLEIRRATNIEFSNATQQWEVLAPLMTLWRFTDSGLVWFRR